MKRKANMGFIILASLLLVGCGAVESADVKGESDNEKITLDWYINYSWYVTCWGENLVSKTITDETGVNVNFITPVGNEEEKLNAMIASNSLPDMNAHVYNNQIKWCKRRNYV